MRKRFWLLTVIIALSLVTYSVLNVYASTDKDVPDTKLKLIEGALYNIVRQVHYLNPQLNDEYADKVFDAYFKNLDYEKKYFTKSEIKSFAQYDDYLDDMFKNSDLTFFNLVDSVYESRLSLTQKWYQEILNKPFDYTLDEEVAINSEKIDFPDDINALKNRWTKLLKYRCLVKYDELTSARDKSADSLRKVKEYKSDDVLELEARTSTLKTYDRYYKRLFKMSLQDRFAVLMNSYLESIDPHTNYFPPQQKEDFDAAMSGSFFGIGAQLKQEEDNTVVERIIIGSPSFKQGSLKKGDIIQKVAQGDDAPVDISGMDLDEVVRKIRGEKGTIVKLTVLHIDGQVEVVPIVRDKVDMEDTYVKSAIINSSKGKIGYISLPEFYFDMNERDGRTCSKDMAIEVKNLNDEKVTGIIIDLRNNGGGSLTDVVKIVGLFIDKGPVVMVRDRNGDIEVLDDTQAGTYFDGPVTVLVNEGSASASEILAAALQDYRRATIIGNTTYGKGTVQRFVDLNQVVPGRTVQQYLGDLPQKDQDMGSLKVTIQKFYRINGGSTQRKGVIPDIKLDDIYQDIDKGERQSPSAMPWDSIQPSHYKLVNNNANWNAAAMSKISRYVSGSQYFQDVDMLAEFMKNQSDQIYTTINLGKYRQEKKNREDKLKVLDKYNSDSTSANPTWVVVTPNFRSKEVAKDSVSQIKNKDWLKNIGKDYYIDAAVRFLENQ